MKTQSYVALIRAVNVGGTGKLAMSGLVEFCRSAGFSQVRTYLASGNAIFRSTASEHEVRAALEARLAAYASKPVGVMIRSAEEIAGVAARNPFAGENGSRVMALFTDAPLPQDPLEGATGVKAEAVRLGHREFFIFYPNGQAETRLRIPAMQLGTARNMNTVGQLAILAQARAGPRGINSRS